MGIIRNFLKRFTAGQPVAAVCSVSNLNRIANILEDIQGVGCRIEKPTNAEGHGWQIVIDGTSDITPPGWKMPFERVEYQSSSSSSSDTSASSASSEDFEQYQVWSKLTAEGDEGWDWVRYVVP